MYIDDQTYQRNSKTYRRVLLRNSYRENGKVKHKTIANLSQCAPEEIEAFKHALKHKGGHPTLPQFSDFSSIKQGKSFGAVWCLAELAGRLGISRALGKNREAALTMWMILATLIAQGSRLSAVRLAQSHAVAEVLGLDGFNEDDLYQAMDWLAANQGNIERRLFAHRYGDLAPDLYLYDVTSSYLEGERNELAEFGYNRDGKKGKKQIVIGLLTDGEGRPISVEVFEGNAKDNLTVKDQIGKLSRRFGVTNVTVVGDRGMIKSAQIEALNDEQFHYITAITRPQIEKMIREDVLQLSLFDDHQLCEVSVERDGGGTVRYILRRNPVRAGQIQAVRESKLSAWMRHVAKKNQYLREHPRASVEKALNEIQTKARKLHLDAWTVIVPCERAIEIRIDSDKLHEISRLDGCYALKTDIPAREVSKEIIHARYKDLAEVEWAFRTMKTTLLEMRGIFVRKAERTRAHVFIIMLSYLLAYELRRYWADIEMTIEEGIQELCLITSCIYSIGETAVQSIPEPGERARALIDKLNIALPEVMPVKDVKIEPRKKIKETRRKKANAQYTLNQT